MPVWSSLPKTPRAKVPVYLWNPSPLSSAVKKKEGVQIDPATLGFHAEPIARAVASRAGDVPVRNPGRRPCGFKR